MAKFTFRELLEMSFSTDTHSHLDDLRNRLLMKGYIRKRGQQYIYSMLAKMEALTWYKEQLEKEYAKGSTAKAGKYFEVATRLRWSIAHNSRYLINDVKCRPAGLPDMRVKIGGKVVTVELKTGTGALVYGSDFNECQYKLGELSKQNPLFVWVWDAEENPLVMRFNDLMEGLESYKGKCDISTWLAFNSGEKRKDGQYSIKFQVYETSQSKLEFLQQLQFEKGMDWDTIIETAEFN